MAKILETSLESQLRMAQALRDLLSLLDITPEFGPDKKSFTDKDFQDEEGKSYKLFYGWISTFLYKEDSRNVAGHIRALRRTLEGGETGEILVNYLDTCDKVMDKTWDIQSKFRRLSQLIESTYIKDEAVIQKVVNENIKYTLKNLDNDLKEFEKYHHNAVECRNKLRDVKLVEEVNGVKTDKREWE